MRPQTTIAIEKENVAARAAQPRVINIGAAPQRFCGETPSDVT